MTGRRVATLASGPADAGSHSVRLDATPLAPGVYVARLQAGHQVTARRFTVGR